MNTTRSDTVVASGSLTSGYDVVVVGAGSSGAIIASRLSEDPSCRVLLLEAGGSDRTKLIQVPGMVAIIHTQSKVKKKFDWGFTTAGQPHLDARALPYTRGKVLGGSSSINGMVFVRGHRSTFDGWAAEGCPGWSYDDVLPSFRKLEDWEGGASDVRGAGGPIKVSRPPMDGMSPVSHAFIEATSGALGIPEIDDYNGHSQEGTSRFQFSYRDGLRYSSAQGYLEPAKDRPNLTILTGATVHRVLFEGSRAIGVRFARDGHVTDVWADREVVLSSGAVGSPHLLLLSGIGPAQDLQRMHLPVRADLPVGRNLHDHLFMPMTFLAPRGGHKGTPQHFFAGMASEFIKGNTWFGRSVFESCAFFRSDAELALPDMQLHALPWAYPKRQDTDKEVMDVDKRACLSIFATLVQPKSRGEVRLRTANPDDKPHIDPHFLEDPADLATLERCVGHIRELCAHPSLAAELQAELEPGKGAVERMLRDQIRHRAFTVYHPVGTCRMGSDERAVVGPDLKVKGFDGLRVADASIMPHVTNGNTNAPCLMIGEHAAAILRG